MSDVIEGILALAIVLTGVMILGIYNEAAHRTVQSDEVFSDGQNGGAESGYYAEPIMDNNMASSSSTDRYQ